MDVGKHTIAPSQRSKLPEPTVDEVEGMVYVGVLGRRMFPKAFKGFHRRAGCSYNRDPVKLWQAIMYHDSTVGDVLNDTSMQLSAVNDSVMSMPKTTPGRSLPAGNPQGMSSIDGISPLARGDQDNTRNYSEILSASQFGAEASLVLDRSGTEGRSIKFQNSMDESSAMLDIPSIPVLNKSQIPVPAPTSTTKITTTTIRTPQKQQHQQPQEEQQQQHLGISERRERSFREDHLGGPGGVTGQEAGGMGVLDLDSVDMDSTFRAASHMNNRTGGANTSAAATASGKSGGVLSPLTRDLLHGQGVTADSLKKIFDKCALDRTTDQSGSPIADLSSICRYIRRVSGSEDTSAYFGRSDGSTALTARIESLGKPGRLGSYVTWAALLSGTHDLLDGGGDPMASGMEGEQGHPGVRDE